MSLLQFQPLSSAVEAPFWHLLSQRKIDLYRLGDDPVSLRGSYSCRQRILATADNASPTSPSRLCLGTGAFDDDDPQSLQKFTINVPGTLYNTNTIEEFKKLDYALLFKKTASQIWNDILKGDALKNPSLLARFLLVAFADLKKYKFYYWFAFPALTLDPPVTLSWARPAVNVLNQTTLSELPSRLREVDGVPFFLISISPEGTISMGRLSDWEMLSQKTAEEGGEMIFGFADPCCLPANPGWPLRNFLALVKKKRLAQDEVKILSVRISASVAEGCANVLSASVVFCVNLGGVGMPDSCPNAVGWEKNVRGKLMPRLTDLAPLMDPARLANTAVDLNLKLMRWRLAPSLQLEKVSATKCLLLGAGTLGCHVARCLLGWGVRHITFVDSAHVSFSNPVRQPLFFFEDCLEGGKPKAQCAADNLKKIFPGAMSVGHMMTIPMPGHAISPAMAAHAQEDVRKLEDLFRAHDVAFLLTDSRESRWLPTLIGARQAKIVINAAMGFDTYLVMRHGARRWPRSASDTPTAVPDAVPADLGCYFCNDVVAPTDSLSDRTLDQQCTVTRPGLSAIASACSVELMITLLHHELGPAAPADQATDPADAATSTPLGLVPHQIRGFLSLFGNLLMVGRAYDRCTACSDKVLDLYEKEGFDFLLKVFNHPAYLEDVTGLTELHRQTEANVEAWDVYDEEEGDVGEMLP